MGDGPVGYWRLNERSGLTAYDASGGGFNGTYTTGMSITPSLGAILGDSDAATLMSATGTQVLSIPSPSSSTSVTMEVWIKSTSVAATAFFYSKYGQFSMSMQSGVLAVWGATMVSTGATINTGAWFHVVLTAQNGVSNGSYAYVNGVQVWNGTLTEGGPTTNAVNIGGLAAFGSYPCVGTYDEAAYYSFILTSSQIQAHYLAGQGMFESGVQITGTPTVGQVPVATTTLAATWQTVYGTQGNQGNQGAQGTQGNQGNQGAQGTQGNQGNQGLQYNFFLQGNQYSLGGSATGVQNVPGLQTGTLVNGAQYIVSAQIGTQCAVGTQGLQFALQCSVASATVSGSALGNQAAAVGGAAVLADQTISAQGVQGPVSTMFTGLGWYEVNAFVLTPGTGSPYIGIQAKGVQSGGNTWVKANSYMSVIRIA